MELFYFVQATFFQVHISQSHLSNQQVLLNFRQDLIPISITLAIALTMPGSDLASQSHSVAFRHSVTSQKGHGLPQHCEISKILPSNL